MKNKLNTNHEKIILVYNNRILDNCILEYKDLYDLLSKTKKEIDKYEKSWDKAKKDSHKYEYIYTSSNSNKNVCGIKLIASRSYFKIIELLKDNDIDIDYKNILCIAEGPGGFLQYLSNRYNNNSLYGITLISKDKNVPYWSPIIYKNKDINLITGIDKDGDLYKMSNINSFVNDVPKCDLITSDGGIDYSQNYNSQELLSYKLLYCEIYTNFKLQKEGGNFIIKFFDILYYNTLQLLYLLYLSYDEIIISKPNTSRLSNSEKYIVCKNYKKNDEIINLMYEYFDKCNKLYIYIPLSFINDIKKYNIDYINLQIKTIKKIISNIDFKQKYDKNERISTAIEWCKKYNVPINKFYIKPDTKLLPI